MSTAQKIVVVGASLGGIDALHAVFGTMPAPSKTAIIVVQHRGEDSGEGLVKLLQGQVDMPVEEAHDKAPLEAGKMVVAPAGYHLLVGASHLALSTEERIHGARPSIHVLFESASRSFGSRATAVVLTSASDDGARGAALIESGGGLVIVQTPSTAQSPVLPEAALAECHRARSMSLDGIKDVLVGGLAP